MDTHRWKIVILGTQHSLSFFRSKNWSRSFESNIQYRTDICLKNINACMPLTDADIYVLSGICCLAGEMGLISEFRTKRPATRILRLTHRADADTKNRAYAEGADIVLSWPLFEEEICVCLNSMIRRLRAEQAQG